MSASRKKVRVGIIGCGVIAPSHIESYRNDPDVEILWACDLVAGRAKAAAERYGIPRWSSKAEDVFTDPAVDAVSLCTPHDVHAPHAVAALAAGKDVLCEKPLAHNLPALRKMLAAAAEHPDRIFAGVFQHRYNPVFRTLRELLLEGKFGTPLTAVMRQHCLRTPAYYADAWRGTWEHEGGGVLINQAIHYLDLLQWVMGGVKDLDAFYANRHHLRDIETEDTVVGALRFENGALGTFEATNASNLGWETMLDVHGTEGSLVLRDGEIVSAVFADDAIRARLEAAVSEAHEAHAGRIGKGYYGYGHPAQVADFVRAVRDRKPVYVSAEDAAETVKLVMKVYKAAKLHSPAGPGGRKPRTPALRTK